MKTSEEFRVGKHQIGWISSSILSALPATFKKRTSPTYQVTSKTMSFAELPECELGHILSFLENPPEECKDGYGNYFKCGSLLVCVRWGGVNRGWDVGGWAPGDDVGAGRRVFSGNLKLGTSGKTSDALSLESLTARVEKLEALFNPKLL